MAMYSSVSAWCQVGTSCQRLPPSPSFRPLTLLSFSFLPLLLSLFFTLCSLDSFLVVFVENALLLTRSGFLPKLSNSIHIDPVASLQPIPDEDPGSRNIIPTTVSSSCAKVFPWIIYSNR